MFIASQDDKQICIKISYFSDNLNAISDFIGPLYAGPYNASQEIWSAATLGLQKSMIV